MEEKKRNKGRENVSICLRKTFPKAELTELGEAKETLGKNQSRNSGLETRHIHWNETGTWKQSDSRSW